MNVLANRLLRQNLSRLGPELSTRIFHEFDRMYIETTEGQAMDLASRRDKECRATEEDYLLMVLKKTSWYSFIHPLRVGALIAQPNRTDLDNFNRLGYFLGTAFQIQDDIVSVACDRTNRVKEIDADLLEGKGTFPLTHLFRVSNAQERAKLTVFFAKPRAQRLSRDVSWTFDRLRFYGSVDYARKAAREFAEGALHEFSTAFAGAPESVDLDFLRGLLAYMASRDMRSSLD
jgi:geranylgeranyl diphosphate synthase type II